MKMELFPTVSDGFRESETYLFYTWVDLNFNLKQGFIPPAS